MFELGADRAEFAVDHEGLGKQFRKPDSPWFRQDGFALTTRDWWAATDARDSDLLNSTFAPAIEAHEFIISDGDCTELADVLSTAADPIPQHLQNLLCLFAEHQFAGALTPKLAEIVDMMWNEEAS